MATSFASRLRSLREKNSLRQSDMAAILGISTKAYVGYEDDYEPPVYIVSAIAKHFNVSFDYLIGRTKSPEVTMPAGGVSFKERTMDNENDKVTENMRTTEIPSTISETQPQRFENNVTGEPENEASKSLPEEPENATRPSQPRGGVPEGNYANPNGGRGLVRQNETADLLADHGYKVEMLDEIQGGNGHGIKPGSNPDFIIEDRVFDCYSPDDSTSIEKVCDYMKTKTKTQSTRIVLNLDDYSSGQMNALQNKILERTTTKANDHLRYLDELIIVRDKKIENFFVR